MKNHGTSISGTVLLTIVLIFSLTGLAAAEESPQDGALLCISSGQGEIRLLWAPPTGYWPAGGWRLQDQNGRKMADIAPLAPEYMQALVPEDRQMLQDIVQGLTGPENPQTLRDLKATIGLVAMTSFDQALALGVAHILRDQPGDDRSWTVLGLDGAGQPDTVRLQSAPVDAQRATPLPAAPDGLRIEMTPEGALLFWNPAPQSDAAPVIVYDIARTRAGTTADLGAAILGVSWNSTQAAFVDTTVQPGAECTYAVSSRDAFGRHSKPATATLFLDDAAAMGPPQGLHAASTSGRVHLSWQPSDNPNTAGYALERGTAESGVFELLTPRALERRAATYTDKDVLPGMRYYYRIRAVNPDGVPGEPSQNVLIRIPVTAPPPQPANVQVTAGPIQAELTWDSPNVPVAGYIVEKRSGAQWNRLNPTLLVERVYADSYAAEAGGTFYYRVIAVAPDNSRSAPSREVRVDITAISPPPTPRITDVHAAESRITIHFEPGRPVTAGTTLTLMRGPAERRQGKILAANLPPEQSTYTDTDVRPGQGYWYALLAASPDGGESSLSDKRLIMAVAPAIPAAPAPKLTVRPSPFLHVEAVFPHPAAPVLVALQRQDAADGPWRTIIRGIAGKDVAIDANPPASGPTSYRLVLHTPDGRYGDPSPPVLLKR